MILLSGIRNCSKKRGMTASNEDINWSKADILDILYHSEVKLTPAVLVRKIRERLNCSARAAKKIINRLVAEQELTYHQMYGATYIEKSFLRPVRVTGCFVLSPPGFRVSDDPGSHTLIIEPGISFGSGQHPTTRLCLEAIDCCFFLDKRIHNPVAVCGADVGTGSGVLAMAMAKAGLGSCKAYEIDPVSVHEARKNVAANSLESRIEIIEDVMPPCPDAFGIICANLRYPTLIRLAPLFEQGLTQNGVLILSGIREWEKKELVDDYHQAGFNCVWQEDENRWSCVMLVKAPTPN